MQSVDLGMEHALPIGYLKIPRELPMYEAGDRVVIKDGTGRHGSVGVVQREANGIVYVMLEYGLVWPVATAHLEPFSVHPPVSRFVSPAL